MHLCLPTSTFGRRYAHFEETPPESNKPFDINNLLSVPQKKSCRTWKENCRTYKENRRTSKEILPYFKGNTAVLQKKYRRTSKERKYCISLQINGFLKFPCFLKHVLNSIEQQQQLIIC
jgi:hypothetical protein